MVFVLFHHFGHTRVGGRADARHRRLRLLIRFYADLVDAVCDVLLLRGLERFGQRIIKHDTLLGVRLQLVNQHHLRGCLILQRIYPGLALLDIALKRLALGELDLFLLCQFVIARVRSGQFGFQLGARGGVQFIGNRIFQLDDVGVHRLKVTANCFQFGHRQFAFIQRLCQVAFDLGFLVFEHAQLAFEQLHNHVGFGDQIL